jgi:hypothetical protein
MTPSRFRVSAITSIVYLGVTATARAQEIPESPDLTLILVAVGTDDEKQQLSLVLDELCNRSSALADRFSQVLVLTNKKEIDPSLSPGPSLDAVGEALAAIEASSTGVINCSRSMPISKVEAFEAVKVQLYSSRQEVGVVKLTQLQRLSPRGRPRTLQSVKAEVKFTLQPVRELVGCIAWTFWNMNWNPPGTDCTRVGLASPPPAPPPTWPAWAGLLGASVSTAIGVSYSLKVRSNEGDVSQWTMDCAENRRCGDWPTSVSDSQRSALSAQNRQWPFYIAGGALILAAAIYYLVLLND